MGHSSKLRLGAILALGVTAAVMLASAASAGPPVREVIHDEFSSVESDFCGAGLTVEIAVVLDIRVAVRTRGTDGLAYFMQHGTSNEVLTNLDNGTFVTSHAKVLEKDKRVTDNGDGTLTILILATGNATLYGPNGKAIARNPGQTRFELVVDHGGTPNDPDDDEVVDFQVVKGSTGRSDDFCDAAVATLS